MLFQNCSWQDFLWFAAFLSLLWYGLLWYLCFRKQKENHLSTTAVHGEAADWIEEDLLGKPVLAEGEALVSTRDFGFFNADQVEESEHIAALQNQIRLCCRGLESSLAEKEAFLAELATLLAGFPLPLAARQPLEEFIREQLPFYISHQELERLWM
jgi:hypothetical protein